MLYSIELWSHKQPALGRSMLLGRVLHHALRFLDAGLLTSEVAEVEDAGATDLTDFVEFNLVNRRGLVGEDSLDTDAVGNLADGGGLRVRGSATNLDHHATEALESLLVAFLDPVGHRDGVTGLELRVGSSFVLGERLLH